MAIELPGIRQRIEVDSSPLDGLAGKFGKVGRLLGTAVAGGIAAAGAALGAFVAQGIRGAVDVERGLREVNTLFGLSGEEGEQSFRQMQAGVADLSDELGVAQSELTGGLYQAISAGVPRDNVFEFMRVASKAAIGGVTDTETAIDGITTTLNAFGLETDQAEAVADSMFAAVKGGKTTFEELSASLSNVAPAAAAAGVGYDEVNAAIATLTAAGVPTAQATTQIRAALVGLQRPSAEMTGIFNALGYESAQAAIEAEGMQFALDAVASAADGDNGKLTTLLGSVEAVGAANVLAGTGAEKFRDELERQAGSAGASGDAFAEMEKTTSRSWDRFKVGVQNVAISVGSVLLPPLVTLIEKLGDVLIPVLETVGAVIGALVDGDLWQLARTLGATGEQADAVHQTFAGAFAGIGELGGWLRDVIAGVGDRIREIVGKITGTVEGRMGEIQGAFAFARDRIGSIMESLSAIIDGVLEVISVAWDLFGEHIVTFLLDTFRAVMRIVDGALRVVRGIFDVVLGVLTGDWGRAWDGIKGIVGGALDVVRGIIERALAVVMLVVRSALSLLRALWDNTLGRLVTVVGDKIDEAVDWFRELPDRVRDTVSGAGTWLKEAGRNVIQGLIDGITSKVRAVGDAVSGVVESITDRLPWSPAKTGPLAIHPPEEGGANVGSLIARGLERQKASVAAAAANVAGAVAAGISSANTVGIRPALAGAAPTAGPETAPVSRSETTIHVSSNDPIATARAIDRELAWQSLGRS